MERNLSKNSIYICELICEENNKTFPKSFHDIQHNIIEDF